MMKRLKYLLILLSVGLASCIVETSVPMARSCVLYAKASPLAEQPRFYRLGEQYYVRVEVRYGCHSEDVCIAEADHWRFTLPIGYHTEREPQIVYVLLTPDAVKHYLGKVAPEPSADTPGCIQADEWDEAAAVVCVPRRKIATENIRLGGCSAGREHAEYEASWDALCIFLPKTYSRHALYRFPLAAVMALGIDIPCTLVINSGMVVAGIAVMPFRQQSKTTEKEATPETN